MQKVGLLMRLLICASGYFELNLAFPLNLSNLRPTWKNIVTYFIKKKYGKTQWGGTVA